MNHIVRKTVNPSTAPTEAGIHWINTTTNEEFFSVGTSVLGDWIPRANGQVPLGGTTGQNLVKSSDTDFDTEWSTSLGDVVGPVLSAENAVVRFDGITGKLIKDSGVIIDDDGIVTADDFKLSDELFSTISTKEILARSGATGTADLCILSIGTPNNTFNISAGVLVFGSYVSPLSLENVEYPGAVNVPATLIGAAGASYVGIDANGAIVQQVTSFTGTQRRSIAAIGILVHSNFTNITGVNQTPTIIDAPASQIADISLSIGTFNITGNAFSAIDGFSPLKIKKSLGTIFRYGSNWAINEFDPHVTSLSELNPATYIYLYQTGTVAAPATNINPNTWDVGGTPTLVANNKFTIQRIYSFSNNSVVIQPGQIEYASLDLAVAAKDDPVVTLPAFSEGLLRCYLIVKKGTTDLTIGLNARFIEAPRFSASSGGGGGGVAASTRQSTYDNSTPNPETLTNAINGADTWRQGSGADTDNVLAVQNAAGTNTFTVSGNGDITAGLFNGGVPSSAMDIQMFPSSGTWNKPVWATGDQIVRIALLSGGGGGGSGRKRALATTGCGGGGGAGGALVIGEFFASSLTGTVPVTVGAGGFGGAGQATNSTNGINGLPGGNSEFGTYLRSLGGNGGSGGVATTGAGGVAAMTAITPWNFIQLAGGASGANGTAGTTAGASNNLAPTGGGGGGGVTATEVSSTAGSGGTRTSQLSTALNAAGGAGAGAPPANGGAGIDSPFIIYGMPIGTGGGGSRGNAGGGTTGDGGQGGAGGGGGGGGASTDSVATSGAGGAGGNGWVVVVTFA